MSSDSSVNSSSFTSPTTVPVLKPTENQPKKDAEPESEFASYKNGILKIKIGENEFRKVKITKIGGKEITPDSLKGERLQAIIDVFRKFIENKTTKHVLASKDLTHYKASYDNPSSTATLHGAVPEVPLQDVEAKIVEKSEDKPIGELFDKIIREPAEKVAKAEVKRADEKEFQEQPDVKELEEAQEEAKVQEEVKERVAINDKPKKTKPKIKYVGFEESHDAAQRGHLPKKHKHYSARTSSLPEIDTRPSPFKRQKSMSKSVRNLFAAETPKSAPPIGTQVANPGKSIFKRAVTFLKRKSSDIEIPRHSTAPKTEFIEKLKFNVQKKIETDQKLNEDKNKTAEKDGNKETDKQIEIESKEADEKSMAEPTLIDKPIDDSSKTIAAITAGITYTEMETLIQAYQNDKIAPREVRTELLSTIQEALQLDPSNTLRSEQILDHLLDNNTILSQQDDSKKIYTFLVYNPQAVLHETKTTIQEAIELIMTPNLSASEILPESINKLIPAVLSLIQILKLNKPEITSGEIMVEGLETITTSLDSIRHSHPTNSNTCEAAIILDLILQQVIDKPGILKSVDVDLIKQIRIFNIGNKPDSYKEWVEAILIYFKENKDKKNDILKSVPGAFERKGAIKSPISDVPKLKFKIVSVFEQLKPELRKTNKLKTTTLALIEGLIICYKKVSKTTLRDLLEDRSAGFLQLLQSEENNSKTKGFLEVGIPLHLKPLFEIYDYTKSESELPFTLYEQYVASKANRAESYRYNLNANCIFKSLEEFLLYNWGNEITCNVFKFLAIDKENITQLRQELSDLNKDKIKSPNSRLQDLLDAGYRMPLAMRQIELFDIIIKSFPEYSEIIADQSELNRLKSQWIIDKDPRTKETIEERIVKLNDRKQKIISRFANIPDNIVPNSENYEKFLKGNRILNLILMDRDKSKSELVEIEKLNPAPKDEIAILQYKLCQTHELPSEAVIRLISKR